MTDLVDFNKPVYDSDYHDTIDTLRENIKRIHALVGDAPVLPTAGGTLTGPLIVQAPVTARGGYFDSPTNVTGISVGRSGTLGAVVAFNADFAPNDGTLKYRATDVMSVLRFTGQGFEALAAASGAGGTTPTLVQLMQVLNTGASFAVAATFNKNPLTLTDTGVDVCLIVKAGAGFSAGQEYASDNVAVPTASFFVGTLTGSQHAYLWNRSATGNMVIGTVERSALLIDINQRLIAAPGNALPSTWSTGRSFEIGDVGQGLFGSTTGINQTIVVAGLYYNAAWKYARAGNSGGSYLELTSNALAFYNAPAGTVNTTATMTKRLQLSANVFSYAEPATATLYEVGWRPVPISTKSANYTFVRADRGTLVRATLTTALSFTLPTVAAVGWEVGDVIEVSTMNGPQCTIVYPAGGFLQKVGAALASANVVIPANSRASLHLYQSNDYWVIDGYNLA